MAIVSLLVSLFLVCVSQSIGKLLTYTAVLLYTYFHICVIIQLATV